MKTISLLGSGWLGFALAKFFQSKGFQVKASTRSTLRMSELLAIGVQPYLIDIENITDEVEGFLQSDVVIVNITSKNRTGFNELIKRIEGSAVRKILFVSSSSVYLNTNQVVSESSGMEDINSELYKIEKQFQSSTHFQTTIVRMSGLIGANRHPGRFFREGKVVQQPNAPVNLIHQLDCVNIVGRIVELDVWGEVLNASADTHPTKRVFYTQARKSLGQPPPNFSEQDDLDFKVVDNQKVKRILNYEFVYADLLGLINLAEGDAFDA